MNKKKVIGVLVFAIIILFVLLSVLLIRTQYKNKNKDNEFCDRVLQKFLLIINGECLEANMNFIDNYSNKEIQKIYMNLSKEELIEKNYIEYIQDADYMLEFYKKIIIEQVKVNEETDKTIKFTVYAKRPNLLKVMNECDDENVNNINYNFNQTFINKMNLEDFTYEEGTYNIIVHKTDDDIKFEYTDEFKELLYSENN